MFQGAPATPQHPLRPQDGPDHIISQVSPNILIKLTCLLHGLESSSSGRSSRRAGLEDDSSAGRRRCPRRLHGTADAYPWLGGGHRPSARAGGRASFSHVWQWCLCQSLAPRARGTRWVMKTRHLGAYCARRCTERDKPTVRAAVCASPADQSAIRWARPAPPQHAQSEPRMHLSRVHALCSEGDERCSGHLW